MLKNKVSENHKNDTYTTFMSFTETPNVYMAKKKRPSSSGSIRSEPKEPKQTDATILNDVVILKASQTDSTKNSNISPTGYKVVPPRSLFISTNQSSVSQSNGYAYPSNSTHHYYTQATAPYSYAGNEGNPSNHVIDNESNTSLVSSTSNNVYNYNINHSSSEISTNLLLPNSTANNMNFNNTYTTNRSSSNNGDNQDKKKTNYCMTSTINQQIISGEKNRGQKELNGYKPINETDNSNVVNYAMGSEITCNENVCINNILKDSEINDLSFTNKSLKENQLSINHIKSTIDKSRPNSSSCSARNNNMKEFSKIQPTLTKKNYQQNNSDEKEYQYRYFGSERFMSLCRPQYKTSCSISSLVSVFNFLFYYNAPLLTESKKPNVNRLSEPITQEEALNLLGFEKPYKDIVFGPYAGNSAVLRWFKQLCLSKNLRGSCGYLYKDGGSNGVFKKQQKLIFTVYSEKGERSNDVRAIKESTLIRACIKALSNPKMGIIYHCLNHYNVPIGYEITPSQPTDAKLSTESFKFSDHIQNDEFNEEEHELLPQELIKIVLKKSIRNNSWLLIGDPSKCSKPINCVSMKFCEKDFENTWPYFMNQRDSKAGYFRKVNGLYEQVDPCLVDEVYLKREEIIRKRYYQKKESLNRSNSRNNIISNRKSSIDSSGIMAENLRCFNEKDQLENNINSQCNNHKLDDSLDTLEYRYTNRKENSTSYSYSDEDYGESEILNQASNIIPNGYKLPVNSFKFVDTFAESHGTSFIETDHVKHDYSKNKNYNNNNNYNSRTNSNNKNTNNTYNLPGNNTYDSTASILPNANENQGSPSIYCEERNKISKVFMDSNVNLTKQKILPTDSVNDSDEEISIIKEDENIKKDLSISMKGKVNGSRRSTNDYNNFTTLTSLDLSDIHSVNLTASKPLKSTLMKETAKIEASNFEGYNTITNLKTEYRRSNSNKLNSNSSAPLLATKERQTNENNEFGANEKKNDLQSIIEAVQLVEQIKEMKELKNNEKENERMDPEMQNEEKMDEELEKKDSVFYTTCHCLMWFSCDPKIKKNDIDIMLFKD